MRAFKDIPVPVIVLCFVFGAWPIAVILIILRVLGSNASSGSGSKEKQERNNNIYSYGKTPAQQVLTQLYIKIRVTRVVVHLSIMQALHLLRESLVMFLIHAVNLCN